MHHRRRKGPDYLDGKINEAMEFNEEVLITYKWSNSILKAMGLIHYFDVQNKEIRIITPKGKSLFIMLHSIIEIN